MFDVNTIKIRTINPPSDANYFIYVINLLPFITEEMISLWMEARIHCAYSHCASSASSNNNHNHNKNNNSSSSIQILYYITRARLHARTLTNSDTRTILSVSKGNEIRYDLLKPNHIHAYTRERNYFSALIFIFILFYVFCFVRFCFIYSIHTFLFG